jgi:hypothetical protein
MGTEILEDEAHYRVQVTISHDVLQVKQSFLSFLYRTDTSFSSSTFMIILNSLSSHGFLITHIDKHYKMTRWTLMAQSLAPPSPRADPEQFVQRLVDKLKYCKEVLVSIRTASATGSAVPEESDAMGLAVIAGGGRGGHGHAHGLAMKNINERLTRMI